MRVVLISKAYVVGAYRTKLEAIAAHEEIELFAIVPPSWQGLRLERAYTRGYQLLVLPLVFDGHFHLHFYPSLAAALRHLRPDVCHIEEEPYNLATYLAVRAAKKVGSKVLFFTWQNLLRRYPPPFRQMERYVYARVDAAIAGNQEAAQVLRAKGYKGKLQVLPQFGVDPQVFSPQAKGTKEGTFTVGYAGRLVEEKGLWILARALRGLEGDWQLLICGEGPLQEKLENYFSNQGLRPRVHFLGHLSSAEMPAFLNRLDVLVLPSLTRPNWKEQFGRVLIEAMACEVPVVGSSSGEIPHVIGDAGIVFPEGNVQALKDALEALRRDAPRRRALGAKGRQRVLAHYTQERIAAETVALYCDLLKEHDTAAKGGQ
ncbi:MAG: glycosyltransferase family 4 protein [Anaerolineae bacterium]|nr:glycosyltransferase family 4 protein [Anaerolineae bacterium]